MDSYDIIHLIGKGRTGGVYQAADISTGQIVAIRRFYDDDGSTKGFCSDARFLHVIEERCKIDHPNLAKIIHGDSDEDGPYLVAELVAGDDLHAFLDTHYYMEPWQGMQLAKQILSVFILLHDSGIIHGSLGPSSIIVQPNQESGLRYVILDTGLSDIVSTLTDDPEMLERSANIVMQPPELLLQQPATAQSDLYMLGQILYYMLAGAHPFAELSKRRLLLALEDGMPSLSERRPDLHPEFTQWVDQLIQTDPSHRPQSAAHAHSLLTSIAPDPSFTIPSASADIAEHDFNTAPANKTPIRAIRPLPPITKDEDPPDRSTSSTDIDTQVTNSANSPAILLLGGLLLLCIVSISFFFF